MSEFSDRPLVAGDLVGLRAFRVLDGGHLSGVVHAYDWRPGVNEAACQSNPLARALRSVTQTMQAAMTGIVVFQVNNGRLLAGVDPSRQAAPDTAIDAPEEEHRVAQTSCRCGFYAYFDGGNDYFKACDCGAPHPPVVAGLIRGYGTVTVGSRGYRSSKAELVALVRPSRLRRLVAGRPLGWRDVWEALFFALLLTSYVATVWRGDIDRTSYVLGVLLTSLGWVRGLEWVKSWRGRATVNLPDRRLWRQVRDRYPNVPVYRSQKAAVRAHPLGVPPTPTDVTEGGDR